ncbi:MAG: 16S rRNA (cytosine(1402)-N(4))-methyltransferase RsmH [Spirochaetales bacterium]|nr:16S rRNA (cytosine(1402)-N(4))-methyltransferase RsmH [Spirochaetales bacterium]
MENKVLHYSVMSQEVMEYLSPAAMMNNSLMIDCTLGEGGHSELFLKNFSDLRLVGLDCDSEIIKRAEQRLVPYRDRVTILNTWFDEFFAEPERYGNVSQPSCILLDLGISMFHYEASGRGFSFNKDEPLDMRLSSEEGITAEFAVNTYGKDQLADVIYQYGEERYSRRISAAICKRRSSKAIQTSADLADIIKGAVPKDYRHGRIHPATRTFQALRIEVNDELGRIERSLDKAVEMLQPGGRIAVISFHSLEDRRVKQTFKKLSKGCICPPEVIRCECGGVPTLKLLHKKPLRPTDSETKNNPASRSAKLRCAEKVSKFNN